MRKAIIILGSIVLSILLLVGGYGFYLYKSVQGTVDSQMHSPLDRDKSERREIEVNLDEEDPLSFLLLGTDQRSTERARTDTIMVVTVNPNDQSMKMVSIPRDTRTEIVGRGFQDKINHAYAFGGEQMAIDTVENFLDIPIDYFVTVNMEGFTEIVDSVGGVSVYNDFSFSQSGHTFEQGDLFLNGEEALAFSRMRYEDARGDLGRNERQRDVVNALIREGAQFSSVTKIQDIVGALGNNVQTNLDFADMMDIVSGYTDARRNQDTLEFTGEGQRIDGIWYLIVSEEKRAEISGELRNHLNLDDSNEEVATGE